VHFSRIHLHLSLEQGWNTSSVEGYLYGWHCKVNIWGVLVDLCGLWSCHSYDSGDSGLKDCVWWPRLL